MALIFLSCSPVPFLTLPWGPQAMLLRKRAVEKWDCVKSGRCHSLVPSPENSKTVQWSHSLKLGDQRRDGTWKERKRLKGCSWGRLKDTIRNEEETGKSKERTRRSKRAKKKGGGKDKLFQCAVRYGRDGPVGWKRRQSRGGEYRKPRDEWTGGRDEKIERASVTQEEKVGEGVEEVITV